MGAAVRHVDAVGLTANAPTFVLGHEAGRREFSTVPAPLTVEFFGPAGAGKSTLATAVDEKLRSLGISGQLLAHGEVADRRARGGSSLAFRLSKIPAALRALMPDRRVDAPIRHLMTIIPAGNWMRTIRIRRYAVGLCRAWNENRHEGEITILDQGFVTLLCSLALLTRPIDRSALRHGLALIPRADLLVHVESPRSALEHRLQERLSRRGVFERWYGNDLESWMRQAELASALDDLLTETGRPPIRVRSLNQTDLATSVEKIVREIQSSRGSLAK